jgi:hypothetical protein
MSVFEDSTTNGWLRQHGPINLRHSPKVDRARRDLAAAEGIIKSGLFGLNIVLAIIILCELLSGCAAAPVKTLDVTWADSSCSHHKVIRFVDSSAPVLDCIANSSAEDAIGLGALLILGVPAAACAIRYPDQPVATVYMAIHSPAAEIWAWQTLRSPNALLEWEIDNAMGRAYPWMLPWLQTCL